MKRFFAHRAFEVTLASSSDLCRNTATLHERLSLIRDEH